MKKIHHILKYLGKLVKNPKQLISTYRFHFSPETLIKKNTKNTSNLMCHIAAFTPHNSGDALQTILVRDIFKFNDYHTRWKLKHVHTTVEQKDLERFNSSNAIVIGSGGLILPLFEDVSGWQWNCDVNTIKKINKPIIGFALGYNLFRGHDITNNVFLDNINTTISKSIFWGMRNRGSVNSLKEIVKDDVKDRITFQPCITTLLSKVYPSITNLVDKQNVVALNCAFDRDDKRFGVNKKRILNDIAKSCKTLSETHKIHYFANAKTDEEMLPYLQNNGVSYVLVKLYEMTPKQIIETYSYPQLVMGMRGHAQLIPFGCGTKILSLVSHNKLQWFLDDIEAPEWGIDVNVDELENRVTQLALNLIQDKNVLAKIESEKQKLFEITTQNLNHIIGELNKS